MTEPIDLDALRKDVLSQCIDLRCPVYRIGERDLEALFDAAEERDRLQEQIADDREVYREVMQEACDDEDTDRVHCTCVPYLREIVRDLRRSDAILAELRKIAPRILEELERRVDEKERAKAGGA